MKESYVSAHQRSEVLKYGKIQDEADGTSFPETTLIVCKTSSLSKWQEKVREHLMPDWINGRACNDVLSVYLYHGKDRSKDPKKLRKFDIMLTTYSVLSIEKNDEESSISKIAWRRIILQRLLTMWIPHKVGAGASSA